MPIMAKKNRPPKDQHASSFMVRLPEVYRELLTRIREQTRRPMTEEVKIALEKHGKEMGLWPLPARQE